MAYLKFYKIIIVWFQFSLKITMNRDKFSIASEQPLKPHRGRGICHYIGSATRPCRWVTNRHRNPPQPTTPGRHEPRWISRPRQPTAAAGTAWLDEEEGTKRANQSCVLRLRLRRGQVAHAIVISCLATFARARARGGR